MLTGHYAWGGEMFVSVISTERATEYLIMLLLKVFHPEATIALVKAIAADNADGLKWAYDAALVASDPNLFTLRLTVRPKGTRAVVDLMPPTLNGSAAPSPNLAELSVANTSR